MYMYMSMSMCMCVCRCSCSCRWRCMCICIYIYLRTCACDALHACIHIYVFVVYIYTYTHTHTCLIRIRIVTQSDSCTPSQTRLRGCGRPEAPPAPVVPTKFFHKKLHTGWRSFPMLRLWINMTNQCFKEFVCHRLCTACLDLRAPS